MNRRDFLGTAAAVLAIPLGRSVCIAEDRGETSRWMTVEGEVAASHLGPMLPHEHVLVDFIGADKVRRDRYDADEVFQVMLPYLTEARAQGCRTMAECTPAYLGRDPMLLRRLAVASGVKLMTNTGYYGARNGMFLPQYAFRETAEELSRRWAREWTEGINGTGIRPGFIKIGVDSGALGDVNRKLVEAAARCHLQTGLVIAGHTGDGQAAREQIQVLRSQGVAPGAWIWVHAQNERNVEIHQQIAGAGAWVEFDGVGPASVDQHVELVQIMKRAGLLERVLLSHDAGWYSVGEPCGGTMRGYDTLFTRLVPALGKAGLTTEEIQQLVQSNPARAFAIGVRRA
jgi:phosphotriesterase-related protein